MNPTISMRIADRTIGAGNPCFIIAEAGVNHNGSLERALELIDCAAEAGADAVKFQTFKAGRLVTPQADQANYQRENMGQEISQLQMLTSLELSWEDHLALVQRCQKRGILFLSTPFDHKSAELLDKLDVPALKVASGEITNLPLLTQLANLDRPMIVSTGMCQLGEVEQAVKTIQDTGNDNFAILHCVSDYPADPKEVNLRAMQTLRSAFGKPVGFSDHTLGTEIGIASAALGACILEKHFTLDRTLPGPDHCASLEPDELVQLVRGIRSVESALGDGRKAPSHSEKNTAEVARKSLVTSTNIPAGTLLTTELIDIKRPGTGLPPALKPQLLNRRAVKDLSRGHLLSWEDVA